MKVWKCARFCRKRERGLIDPSLDDGFTQRGRRHSGMDLIS